MENVGAGASTSASLTPSVPLTKLLRGGGLRTALLLLALATTGATPLCNSATSSTTASAASATSTASATPAAATAATASTAAANTSTTTTTPTTTSTPSTASTTTSTAPATPTSAPAPLAPASAAAPARGRRSTDRLETTKVGRAGSHGPGGAAADWLPFVEKQAECVVKRIRTDRGGEFLGAEMTAWLKKQGIQRELTTAYTPQSNGVAERPNRTILETARALLIESGVGNSMWPHAVRHATVARNRVLTKVVAHVPKKYRSKLGASAIWCVHLGLAAESKGWLLWEPSKGVLFDSREPGDYVVESEVEGGRVLGTDFSRKRSAVACVTSAEVRNEVSDCGKSSKVREQVWQEEAAKGSSLGGGEME
ncbi:unnamed protein product [Closterium sp. NIES-53]